MKKVKRLLALFLISVMAVSLLAACSKSSETEAGSDFEGSSEAASESQSKPPKETNKNNFIPNNKNPLEESNEVDISAYSYYPTVSDVMPQIHIDTPNGSNSWATSYGQSDKRAGNIDYVDAFVSTKECEAEHTLTSVAAQVKVRGNYTLEYPKKPIRIKLTQKDNLLGLHGGDKYKNWVLLADWKDLSMSNNALAYYLGNVILGSDGYYCTDFRNVEVYLNGEYWGVYLLAEQQEVKDDRTSVPEVEAGYTGTDIGYFFEFDGYYNDERNMPNGLGDPTFEIYYSGGSYQKGYTVKSDINDNAQLEFLQNFTEKAYAIAYQATKNGVYYTFNEDYSRIGKTTHFNSAKEAVAAVIDIQSLVDVYILNEIACDADVAWSSFYMSLDMTADGNKKITFEAPWDFDSCFGIKKNTCNDAQTMFAANSSNPWFKLVTDEEWFMEMVYEKWAQMTENRVQQTALDLVEEQRIRYADYYVKNYNRWSERLMGNGELIDQLNTYRDAGTAQKLASEYLYNWLKKRFAYLDSQWGNPQPPPVVSDEIPQGSTCYRYEAEFAELSSNFTATAIRTNRSYASGNSYVGDVHTGRTITFTVTATEDTQAYLFAGICKMTVEEKFSSWFTLNVNGENITLPVRYVPTIEGDEEEWHTFIAVKLASIELKAGENKISFTALRDTANFDYIQLYSTVSLS